MQGTRTVRRGAPLLLSLVAAVGPQREALALDKQGKGPHQGAVESEDASATDLEVSGSLSYAVSLYNPTYGAWPDNSGLALFRYDGHADIDLIGRRLSIPVDINVFTDGTRKGVAVFAPSELDVITGFTSTFPLGPGDVEVGFRFEQDRPVDRGGFTQTAFDTRARYLYSLRRIWPALDRSLRGGDVEGWATVGWFSGNASYPARPDNTGSEPVPRPR